MRRSALLLLLVPLAAPALAQDGVLPGLFEQYCAECHRGTDAAKDFVIDAAFEDATGAAAQRALVRLRSRTMPPPDEVQPTDAERRELLALLAARAPSDPSAQVPRMRRLSRAEYQNTVRDLFGCDLQVGDLLPEDARVHGFDNLGDGAGVTPLLFEKYLDAAAALAPIVLADADARRRLRPDGELLAASVARLLDRAFRRPATQAEIDARCELHDTVRVAGGSHDAALAAVLRSVLASPAFLCRAERDRDDHGLSSYELATRLSYLLTASMPDDALFARAAAGDLHRPEVLTAEAHRLVARDGGQALARRFAAQWLGFADVLQHNADYRRYPQIWDGGLRPALFEEAARFVAAVLAEDRSVLELVDADFTFANGTLRKLYGLPGDDRGGWERVTLPDRRRGGVLGMGAVLMVSSYPLRTSPVLRGKWILDRLLDTPPPPPPANAGTLPADDVQPDALTLRERLERHRRDRSCAACHAQIDPLGFALENFDVLGQWRNEAQGKTIDSVGELPDGTRLDGPIALKDALLARSDDVVRAMAKNLLVYAIGRPLVAADEPELLRVTAATVAGGHRAFAMLDAIVTSPLFTTRGPAPQWRRP